MLKNSKGRWTIMKQFEGKVALITGAGGGQGAAEAKLFAKEGAKVMATDINEDGLAKVANEVENNKGEIRTLKHNTSSEKDWDRTVSETKRLFGTIDILVNNAGILSTETITEGNKEQLEKILQVNVAGYYLGMNKVIPVMQQNGKGAIVNIASIASFVGNAGGAAYTASKGAVHTLTKNAATTYGKDNIRVNSIHPGHVKTPMTMNMENHEEDEQQFLNKQAIPIICQPEDIAQGVLFLASDAAKLITGTELVIDGGLMAG